MHKSAATSPDIPDAEIASTNTIAATVSRRTTVILAPVLRHVRGAQTSLTELESTLEQRGDEFTSARRPRQLESDGAAIGFDSDLESEKAATVTLGLNRPSNQRERVLRRPKAQAMTCRRIFVRFSTPEQIGEQAFAPSLERRRIKRTDNRDLRHAVDLQ
jgi:hypothetical protein